MIHSTRDATDKTPNSDTPNSVSNASTDSALFHPQTCAVGQRTLPPSPLISSYRHPPGQLERFNRGYEGVFESPVHMPEKAPSLLWLPPTGNLAMDRPLGGTSTAVTHVGVQTDESEVE